MKRRRFLHGAALVAGSAAARRALASAWRPMQETPSARLILDLTQPLAIIRPDFLGLGYEVSSVARPGLLSQHNAVYVQLVRSLGSRGVIRVGGNTSDYSSYAPTAQAVSSPETGPGSVVNDTVLHDLGNFLKSTAKKATTTTTIFASIAGSVMRSGKSYRECRSRDRMSPMPPHGSQDLPGTRERTSSCLPTTITVRARTPPAASTSCFTPTPSLTPCSLSSAPLQNSPGFPTVFARPTPFLAEASPE